MKKGVKWLLGLLLLLVCVVLVWMSKSSRPKPAAAPAQPVQVVASYACPQAMPILVATTGKVMAREQTVLQAKNAGYIKKILFKEGQQVSAGQLLIQLDAREQQASVQQKQILLQQARQTYQRNLTASHSGGISQEGLEDKLTAYKQAQNNLQQAKITLQDMQIRAPFTGKIGQLNLSVGQYVTPQSSLVSMLSGSHLRVMYNLPSADLSLAKVGQKLKVIVGGNSYSAQVMFIGTELDPLTQTFAVTAELPSIPNITLYPGQYVQVQQFLGVKPKTLLMPGLSVQTEIGSYYVFVVAGNKAEQTTVKLGERNNGSVEITQGLNFGQLVVTGGASQLRQGSLIHVAKITNTECHS